MSDVTSYRLPNGELIFPYDCGTKLIPPWIIVVRGKARRHLSFGETIEIRELIRVNNSELKRYKTENEAKKALKAYAEKHGLEPAF